MAGRAAGRREARPTQCVPPAYCKPAHLSPSGPGDGEVCGCSGVPRVLCSAARQRRCSLPGGGRGGSQQPEPQPLAADFPEFLRGDLTSVGLSLAPDHHTSPEGFVLLTCRIGWPGPGPRLGLLNCTSMDGHHPRAWDTDWGRGFPGPNPSPTSGVACAAWPGATSCGCFWGCTCRTWHS